MKYTAKVVGVRTLVIGLGDFLSKVQALTLEISPGKLMSYDNYRSMRVDSICAYNGLKTLGIVPTEMEAVVPGYLTDRGRHRRYDDFRSLMRRN